MKKKILLGVLTLILALGIALGYVFLSGGTPEEKQGGSFKSPEGSDSGKVRVSSTTGLPFEGEYKPVLAVIENAPSARPQIGLQVADVVYEVPVEGSVTRFVAVYSDKVPEKILPVRSGRAPFLYIQAEWDALFMHFGGSGSGQSNPAPYTFYGNSLHDDIKIDLEGLTGTKNGIFQRITSKAAPHNVQGNPLQAQGLYTYQPKPLSWRFDNSVYYPDGVATSVNIPMTTSVENFVSYTYDSSLGSYLRFMSGKPFLEGGDNAQIKVKNVIVQHAAYSIKGSVYKDWQLVGSGKAEYYIGGMLVQGSWSKASATAPTQYLDAAGSPMVFKPGNTWIHITQ